MSDSYVLEWSKKQNAFHIQETKVMIEKNLNNMIGDGSNDYIVVFQGSREGCDTVASKLRSRLVDRDWALD
jgi:hypothetical protein